MGMLPQSAAVQAGAEKTPHEALPGQALLLQVRRERPQASFPQEWQLRLAAAGLAQPVFHHYGGTLPVTGWMKRRWGSERSPVSELPPPASQGAPPHRRKRLSEPRSQIQRAAPRTAVQPASSPGRTTQGDSKPHSAHKSPARPGRLCPLAARARTKNGTPDEHESLAGNWQAIQPARPVTRDDGPWTGDCRLVVAPAAVPSARKGSGNRGVSGSGHSHPPIRAHRRPRRFRPAQAGGIPRISARARSANPLRAHPPPKELEECSKLLEQRRSSSVWAVMA